MKFSIIIPIYKVERYLHQCVDSVLSQTYKNIEVILVDDGSPDNCPIICDEYAQKDNRIAVIHQNNAGIAAARNAGIEKASGDYVMCIDSDDFFLHENVLSSVAEKTSKKPDVIMFGYKKYFESDGQWGQPFCPPEINEVIEPAELIKSMLIDNSYNATAWTKAVSLNLIRRNGIHFIPGMVSGEDVDWFLNLLCCANSYETIELPFIAYRQRPDSISHKPKIQSLSDFLWILQTWPERINDRIDDSELRSALLHVMAYYWANTMVLYSTYNSKDVKDKRSIMKDTCRYRKYAISSRAVSMRRIYDVVGFDVTIYLLKILSKLKKHQ